MKCLATKANICSIRTIGWSSFLLQLNSTIEPVNHFVIWEIFEIRISFTTKYGGPNILLSSTLEILFPEERDPKRVEYHALLINILYDLAKIFFSTCNTLRLHVIYKP